MSRLLLDFFSVLETFNSQFSNKMLDVILCFSPRYYHDLPWNISHSSVSPLKNLLGLRRWFPPQGKKSWVVGFRRGREGML